MLAAISDAAAHTVDPRTERTGVTMACVDYDQIARRYDRDTSCTRIQVFGRLSASSARRYHVRACWKSAAAPANGF
jgi:hypothetical protein